MSIIWFINNKVHIGPDADCLTKILITITAGTFVLTTTKCWINQIVQCSWIEVDRLTKEMETFMSAIFVSEGLEHLGFKLLNALPAMLYGQMDESDGVWLGIFKTKRNSKQIYANEQHWNKATKKKDNKLMSTEITLEAELHFFTPIFCVLLLIISSSWSLRSTFYKDHQQTL